MKTNLLLFGLVVGLAGCSNQHRFEVLQQGQAQASRSVLFDRDTGDILLIDFTGDIRNVGQFGTMVVTGKKQQ
jgi:hypothetical protein